MTSSRQPAPAPTTPTPTPTAETAAPLLRLSSRELFGSRRELEIEHEGRIYRLRMTQLNKLILTA